MTTLAIEGAGQVLTPTDPGHPYVRMSEVDLLRITPGSVTCRDGQIEALDADGAADVRLDAAGCAVIPGLVDCHTHLPFAGWRAGEYAQKVAGVGYEDIARAGGGIASSSRALRQASDDDVLDQAASVAAEMLATGTTTFECKSGYGLSIDAEARHLRLASELGPLVTQSTTLTALVAHALTPGHDADAWLAAVEAALPAWLDTAPITALDIYVESIAFTNEHLERVGQMAKARGLALRAHVEQFATHRSVPVALASGARSVDHLACLHPDDIGPLAAAECAAVLLPSAELLVDERPAPGRALADAGAIVAVATDCNPGTSPVGSLPVVIGLAVRRYRLSILEALAATTLNPAWVLGCSDRLGSIEAGKRADLVVLDSPVDHIPYRFGRNPVVAVVVGGELVWLRTDDARRLR
ncbi:MAG: imidazolonepropionase [Acidimicrobiales bacterium]